MPDLLGGSRGILAAHQPLVVPMLLRLGNFRLASYVVLVLSKQKGITLVFKTDPLQNVEVSSTFDSIGVIQKFIQREIEEQLREMFREDLPSIIHRLSQRWIAGRTKVEAPYLHQTIGRTPGSTGTPDSPTLVPQNSPVMPKMHFPHTHLDEFATQPTLAMPVLGIPAGLRPHYFVPRPGQFRFPPQSIIPTPTYLPHQARTLRSTPSESSFGRSTRSAPPAKSHYTSNEEVSFPDIENFDPTYGLRDEALPTRSDYEAFGRLFARGPRGLADLASEREHELDFGDGESAFDYVEWEESTSATGTGGFYLPGPDVMFDPKVDDVLPELESIPAVGGGIITRPRVYHSQSAIKSPLAPSTTSAASLSGASSSTYMRGPASVTGSSRSTTLEVKSPWRGQPMSSINEAGEGEDQYNPYFDEAYDPLYPPSTASRPRVDHPQSQSIAGSSTQASSQAPSRLGTNSTPRTTPPSSFEMSTPPKPRSVPAPSHPHADRPRSLSPFNRDRGLVFGSPSPESTLEDHRDDGIVVRNNTVSQLSALSHSNQTLSPYTRSLSHFTIRSVPPRPVQTKPPNGVVRGRRKRMYRLGSKGPPQDAAAAEGVETNLEKKLRGSTSSPPPPSEFSDEDVNHYFRHAQAHVSPRLGVEGIRRRGPYASSNA
jgi:mitochondrial distribution and morphology protein 34